MPLCLTLEGSFDDRRIVRISFPSEEDNPDRQSDLARTPMNLTNARAVETAYDRRLHDPTAASSSSAMFIPAIRSSRIRAPPSRRDTCGWDPSGPRVRPLAAAQRPFGRRYDQTACCRCNAGPRFQPRPRDCMLWYAKALLPHHFSHLRRSRRAIVRMVDPGAPQTRISHWRAPLGPP